MSISKIDALLIAHSLVDSVTDDDFDANLEREELEAAGVEVAAILDRFLVAIELMQSKEAKQMATFSISVDISNAAFKDDPDELASVMAQGIARAAATTQGLTEGPLYDVNGKTVGSFKLTMPKGTT